MSDFAAIEELAQEYFRVLHEGDTDAIKDMFLPECDLTCPLPDGKMIHMTRDEFVELVGSRDKPKDKGYPKYGSVVSIHQSSPLTALLTVDCAVQPRYFIDYLNLIKVEGKWKIAAKVYCITKVEE